MPRARRLLADLSPLRESPAFRRLWVGTTLSSVGGALTNFAVPLQVYDMTRSPFAVGAIGVAELVPILVIALPGGSLADSVDRRRLVLFCSFGATAVSAGLAAQAFAGLRSLSLLYVLVAISSAIGAVSSPARRTFIPGLLSPDRLAAGIALNRLSFQIMLTLGPALAGLITAVPALGLRGCYLIDTLSFAGSLYGVARLPVLPRPEKTAKRGLSAVAEGVRFIRRSQPLAGAFLADLNATVFGLPMALFPAINAERFAGNPRTLGLFMTAIGVGGLVSGAFSGPVGHISRQGRAMLIAVAIWGAGFAGFAIAPSLWLTLACLAIAGAADTFTVIFRGTIVQALTPDELRGRVTAADYLVGAGGGQIGSLESGALGSLTSPTVSAFAGGVATVVGAVVIGLALPAFARYRSEPRATEPAEDSPSSAVAAEA
jgi:MFS family permease